ncbi:LysR family transcriptional regulator [Streptomyces sp. NPDC051452]|uniref:LysR family transcriptional regulator n=1 Tax=Streptomyces sp. NPDC051452 TaxID=3365654 RepID=UPI00378C49AA
MELEVRHLRVLCAIADTGSLHKAARELGLAQPSLSTQLRRIEHALGAQLFVRGRTGCRPTPLGLAVLSRARPMMAEFAAIVTETRAAAARAADGFQLRIGATASRAIPGWLRLLRTRIPRVEPTLQMNVSANALLDMVAAGRLDMAFVHEVEGSPLRIPAGLCLRVLVEREPQFVTLAADHPAASRRQVRLADLAGERWMVDSTVDGEWDALCRVLRAAGLEAEMLHGDYLTAYSLAATGEVVTVSQPTAHPRPDLAIRPLEGDPIGVRLLLAARTEAELDDVYPELEQAYGAVAREAPAYREWLERTRVRDAPGAAPPGTYRPAPTHPHPEPVPGHIPVPAPWPRPLSVGRQTPRSRRTTPGAADRGLTDRTDTAAGPCRP